MKIVVAVVVFNRAYNIKRWLECWRVSANTCSAELVIIDNSQSSKIKELCENVTYIPRKNIGFDIGAMQDVFKERLAGFPNDWDYILWCTDDTWPMSKDFITPFIKKLTEGVGISAMQIAASMKGELHVRTTGFCIRKEISKKITFPADPVTTKQQCYFFEHRGQDQTLTNQIRLMGLSCQAVSPLKTSPLWDTGYHIKSNRLEEHYQVFLRNEKVTFISTIYNGFPQIISSLITQTNPNWELLLIHDGPNGQIEVPKDSRIKYIETEERSGNYGHAIRAKYLQEVKTEFVTITNHDNYYVPTFIEYMMNTFQDDTVGVYCSQMVHSYVQWRVIPCSLKRGFLDCAGMMIRTKEAQAVGWNNISDHSADWVFFADLIKKYGEDKFLKRDGCLLIHN